LVVVLVETTVELPLAQMVVLAVVVGVVVMLEALELAVKDMLVVVVVVLLIMAAVVVVAQVQ
jgi:hypothetical protein